jgi:arylsulfatase A-like enzyme
MYKPESIELPANFRDTMDDKPRVYQRMRYEYFAQLSDAEVKQCIAHYWARLSMQDALFGTMLKTLEETGQADNTIVLYISDHGDYAGAHGLWAKGIPSFDEGYNIPCIMRWPKHAPAGRHVDAFVSTTDLAPTILEAAGATPQAPMSGMSLMPWLTGETPAEWRDEVCSQMNGVEVYYTQRIVRTKTHKYVYNCFDYDELYDLKADPHEMVNLAFPDLARRKAEVQRGQGMAHDSVPWPQLPGQLEDVRRDLVARMWKFALEHNDQIFNAYLTVAFAPYGPGLAYPD